MPRASRGKTEPVYYSPLGRLCRVVRSKSDTETIVFEYLDVRARKVADEGFIWNPKNLHLLQRADDHAAAR